MASSLVLIFAAIGHDTINIPEIFQVFMVFQVALWNLQMSEKSISGKENHWAVVEELLWLFLGLSQTRNLNAQVSLELFL